MRRLHWHIIPLLLALLFVGSFFDAFAHAAAEARILAFTDYHGALEEHGKDVGLAKFMAAIRAHQAAQPNTIVVAVGDLFTGNVESDALRGRPVMEGLTALPVACSAVGNHEFDWGSDKLALWSGEGLPLLSANIVDAAGNPPSGVRPYMLQDVGGMRIAFVGLTTPATPRITDPDNVRGLTFLPPGKALEHAARDARAHGAQVVVALAHLAGPNRGAGWPEGISPDIRELAATPGVDAIVYGHSHEEHLARIGTVPVVQPAYRSRSLAVLTVREDAAAPGGVSVTAALDRLTPRKADLPEDPQGRRIVREARQALGPILDTVEARAPRALETDNSAPTLLGEVVCDALRAAAAADVGIINGGALRDGLAAGDVTLRDISRVLPFNNSLRVLRLNGADLRRCLEYGIIAPGDVPEPPHFVQMSGVRAVYDCSRPKGQRIVSLTLPDGRPVTKDMSLRVAANAFLVKGGDGYPLGKLGRDREATTLHVRDAVAAHIRALGTLPAEAAGWLRPR